MGGLFALLAYGYVIWWGSDLAQRADGVFARLVAAGMTFTLFLYVRVNRGMVMG